VRFLSKDRHTSIPELVFDSRAVVIFTPITQWKGRQDGYFAEASADQNINAEDSARVKSAWQMNGALA
jgi:hypothetical protein